MAKFTDLLALALRFENLKRFIEAQEVYVEDSDWEPAGFQTDKYGLAMWLRGDGETLTLFSACVEQLHKGSASFKTHSCFREARERYLQNSGWKCRRGDATDRIDDWTRVDGEVFTLTSACREQLRMDMKALEDTTITFPPDQPL